MEFNPSFKQIAVAMFAVVLVITGINSLVSPDGGYAQDLADTVSNPSNSNSNQNGQNDGSGDGEDSEEQREEYFDKATNGSGDGSGSDSSSGDGSDSNTDGSGDGSGSDSSSGPLNETEQTKVENDFEGYVNVSNRDNGIFLDRKAISGEWNNIQVMYEEEPVSGAEILVNGKSVGVTGDSGGVYFQVPNADRITVRTTTENLGSVENTYRVD